MVTVLNPSLREPAPEVTIDAVESAAIAETRTEVVRAGTVTVAPGLTPVPLTAIAERSVLLLSGVTNTVTL